MPEIFDYDDGTNETEIELDTPSDVVYVLDGLTTF